ncbi:MAG: hypothetical protein IPK82_25300 [Polyangiaceae bacterium]|nr:hypothetical protein [Polyangiaceae bacterium]
MSDKPKLITLLREADERLAQKKPGRELEERIFSRAQPSMLRAAARFGMWAVPAGFLGLLAFELSRGPQVEQPISESTTSANVLTEPDITPATSDTVHPSNAAATESTLRVPAPIWAPNLPQPAPSGTTNKSMEPPAPAGPVRDRVHKPDLPITGEVEAPQLSPVGRPQKSSTGVVGRAGSAVGSGGVGVAAPQGKAPPTMGAIRSGSKPSRSENQNDPQVNSDLPKDETSTGSSSDDDGKDADAEVHVIGIYDSYGAAAGTEGVASVHINKPGVHVLVLSAYSETAWVVTAGPGVIIKRVIATGYEEQAVTISPVGTTVSTLDYETHGAFVGCGYEWPDTDPMSGCETPELLAQIEGLLQLEPTSFHGCYAASAFVMNVDGSVTIDCWTQGGYSLTGYP